MTAKGRDGSATIVMTGLFDGTHFTPDEGQNWADGGRDFYAAISWSDIPQSDGRRIWIGWMSNHLYGALTPTSPWRGAMTVPRSLSLRDDGDRYTLLQRPVREIEAYRGVEQGAAAAVTLPGVAFDLHIDAEGDATVTITAIDGHCLTIKVDRARATISFNRAQAGLMSDIAGFAALNEAPLRDGAHDVRILCDHCSVEIFADEGASVITGLHFLNAGPVTIDVQGNVSAWRVWEIGS